MGVIVKVNRRVSGKVGRELPGSVVPFLDCSKLKDGLRGSSDLI